MLNGRVGRLWQAFGQGTRYHPSGPAPAPRQRARRGFIFTTKEGLFVDINEYTKQTKFEPKENRPARTPSANDKQVGGDHYRVDAGFEQHWDRIWRLYGRGYFIGCATKYLERYHLKNGVQDLEKAVHFIQKLIELETAQVNAEIRELGEDAGPGYVDQG